jgi:hypothetical protein
MFSSPRLAGTPVRFMVVEVGAHATCDKLVVALKASGGRLSPWSHMLLPEVEISSRGVFKIVILSVRELGFTKELTSLRDIHARGLALGCELCPSDLALSLRTLYTDQPMFEVLYMAMKGLEYPNGRLYFFKLERFSNGGYVQVDAGAPEAEYDLDCLFAFVAGPLV